MVSKDEKSKKRLVLIDGHALLHRAYHAMPELTTSKGERVEAVYGFLRMFLKMIEDLRPTHLAVVLDRPEPTFRHKIYDGYQARRPPTEEPFKEQRGRLYKVMEAMAIPVYEQAGFEADDLLGTLAKQAVQEGGEVIIVTGDRDVLQLVQGEVVRVYMPRKGLSHPVLWDEKAFVDRYGFEPEVLVEYKALVGDAADNYPGVAGVGEKTARRLLERYPSLEQVYQHLDEMSERDKKKLVQGRDNAFLSKELARIRTDAPVELDWDKTYLTNFRSEAAVSEFEELEFGSLLKRILASGAEDRPGGSRVDTEEKQRADQMKLW